jgi:hypothetical protein
MVKKAEEIKEVPKAQRYGGRPEGLIKREDIRDRNTHIYKAHVEFRYTLKEFVDYFNHHYTPVSKIIKSLFASHLIFRHSLTKRSQPNGVETESQCGQSSEYLMIMGSLWQ